MTSITFPSGIQQLATLFILNNPSLTSIRASGLTDIYGDVEVYNSPFLITLDMPILVNLCISINNVRQAVFSALPLLHQLYFPKVQKVGELRVVGLAVELPALTSASNGDFANASSVSLPALQEVVYIISFDNASTSTSLSLPLLTMASNLNIQDSPTVMNLSFPRLVSLREALLITNNPELLNIDGFPVLKKVGDIILRGAFEFVSFPSLEYIEGEVIVSSSNDTFQCPFSSFEKNVTAQGYQFDCVGISS